MSKKVTLALLALMLLLIAGSFAYFSRTNSDLKAALGADRQAAEREIERLDGALASANGQIASLETELNSAKDALDGANGTIEALSGDLAGTKADLDKAENEIAGLDKALTDANAALADAKAQLEETGERLHALTEEAASLSGAVSEMRFRDGAELLPTDPEKAEELLLLSCDGGYAPAALILGEEYLSGEHLEKDLEKAYAFLTLADGQGVSGSKYALGMACFERAEYEKAVGYMTAAADEGSVPALMALGRAYETAEFGMLDMEKAEGYYALAAEKGEGDVKAQAEKAIGDLRAYADAGKAFEDGDYAAALALYEGLGGKYDSRERAAEAKYALAGRLAVTGETEKARELYGELTGYKDTDAILADEVFWGVRADVSVGVFDGYGHPLYYYDGLTGYPEDLESGQKMYLKLHLVNDTRKSVSVAVTTDAGGSWTPALLKAGKEQDFVTELCVYGAQAPEGGRTVRWYVNGREKLEAACFLIPGERSETKTALEEQCRGIRADMRLVVYRDRKEVAGKEPYANTLDDGEYLMTEFTLTNGTEKDFSYADGELMLVIDGRALYWNGAGIKAGQSELRYFSAADAGALLTAGGHTCTVYIKGIAIAQAELEIAEKLEKCGDSLTWTLKSNGLLTVRGTGAMWDLSPGEAAPWGKNVVSAALEYGVAGIGARAFYDCDSLTEIAIPESVTSIGSHAFYDCDGLRAIAVPEGVTEIGNYTFYSCGALADVSIPGSAAAIGNYAFYRCGSLTNVSIPDGVTAIGNCAFRGCAGLSELTIPDSVTAIGDDAFSDCGELTLTVSPGSYAEQYCKDNGLNCVCSGTPADGTAPAK